MKSSMNLSKFMTTETQFCITFFPAKLKKLITITLITWREISLIPIILLIIISDIF